MLTRRHSTGWQGQRASWMLLRQQRLRRLPSKPRSTHGSGSAQQLHGARRGVGRGLLVATLTLVCGCERAELPLRHASAFRIACVLHLFSSR